MDGLTRLRQAREAGLRVGVDGGRLVVEGPRRLEPIARTLLAEKPDILRALADEQAIAWRIDAMRPQVTTRGAIPLLLARPGAPWDAGHCCSCGDRLTPDDRYRCRPCTAAAIAVLANVL